MPSCSSPMDPSQPCSRRSCSGVTTGTNARITSRSSTSPASISECLTRPRRHAGLPSPASPAEANAPPAPRRAGPAASGAGAVARGWLPDEEAAAGLALVVGTSTMGVACRPSSRGPGPSASRLGCTTASPPVLPAESACAAVQQQSGGERGGARCRAIWARLCVPLGAAAGVNATRACDARDGWVGSPGCGCCCCGCCCRAAGSSACMAARRWWLTSPPSNAACAVTCSPRLRAGTHVRHAAAEPQSAGQTQTQAHTTARTVLRDASVARAPPPEVLRPLPRKRPPAACCLPPSAAAGAMPPARPPCLPAPRPTTTAARPTAAPPPPPPPRRPACALPARCCLCCLVGSPAARAAAWPRWRTCACCGQSCWAAAAGDAACLLCRHTCGWTWSAARP